MIDLLSKYFNLNINWLAT